MKNRQKYLRLLEAIRLRGASVKSAPEALGDMAFGARRLLESMVIDDPAEGRRAMLEDLRAKAAEAESTHDPLVIADLIQALTAFLNEEKAEIEATVAARTPAASATPAELPVDASQAAVNQVQPQFEARACECGGKTTSTASPQGAQGGDMDEKEKAELTQQLEAERQKNAQLAADLATLRESGKPAVEAVSGGVAAMTDQERQELQQLRMEKRKQLMESERLQKATEAIETFAKENGVESEALGELLKPAELAAFTESAQWPVLLGMALRNMPSPTVGFAGTGEINMPAPRQTVNRAKREAGSLFRERFGGSAKQDA